MEATKVLNMLSLGLIKELEEALRDEVYKTQLNKCAGVKNRYSAMKKYITYSKYYFDEAKARPYPIELDGVKFNCFLDGRSIVLTRESVGEIQEYDVSNGDYFDIDRMLLAREKGMSGKLNIKSIIAEAKSKGYRFKKDELKKASYILKLNDMYLSIALLDKAYSIINNGEDAEIMYHKRFAPLQIENEIGLAVVLPIRIDDSIIDKFTIIERRLK